MQGRREMVVFVAVAAVVYSFGADGNLGLANLSWLRLGGAGLGAIVLRPTDERATPRRDELETCMDEGKDSLRPLHPSS